MIFVPAFWASHFYALHFNVQEVYKKVREIGVIVMK